MPLPANTSFSANLPGFQFAWDSVSRGAMKKCPRYYQLTIVQGWQTRAQKVDLVFGIWMHEAREKYYKERARNATHDYALDAAVQYALHVTWDRDLGRPWFSDNPNKNRHTLLRSIIWYLDQWRDDPFSTIILPSGNPAVELSFNYDSGLRSTFGQPILLCGHIDRLVSINGMTLPTDLKTTKSTIGTASSGYFLQFNPDDQMTGYCHATQQKYGITVTGIVIDAVQVAVGFSRMLRGHSPRSQSQIDEWFAGFHELTQRAEAYARSGFYPMNEKACTMYGGCEMRPICQRPAAIRERFLAADYAQRVWDPLVVRGD